MRAILLALILAVPIVGCSGAASPPTPPPTRTGGILSMPPTPTPQPTASAAPSPTATPVSTPVPPPTPTLCPADRVCTVAGAVADLREWLPDAVREAASYRIETFYSMKITTSTITLSVKTSNWNRDILEGFAFDFFFQIAGDLPADVPYRPTIALKLRSALDTSYLLVTTPGSRIDRILDSSDPERAWRNYSKFTVSGHLY